MITLAVVGYKVRDEFVLNDERLHNLARRHSAKITLFWQGAEIAPQIANVEVLRYSVNEGAAFGRQMIVNHLYSQSENNDIIVFLDDDLCIDDDSDWLSALIAPIQQERADIAGVEGMRVTDDWYTLPSDAPDYVSGGWCAVRFEVFRHCRFDMRFNPIYWEDVDLCWQARRKGFRLTSVGYVGLSHPNTGKGSNELFMQSRQRFVEKWQWQGERP